MFQNVTPDSIKKFDILSSWPMDSVIRTHL